MKTRFKKYYVWLPLLLLCIFYLCRAIVFPVHDFANYYFGGYFLGQHQFNSHIYFPYFFNKDIVALGYQPLFAGFAPNTPLLAMLLYPFTLFPLMMAKFVFNCISVMLFIYSLYRLVAFYKINPVYILLVPVLFLVPLKNEILFGQVYLLLFFLLAESWLAYAANHFKKAAFFLSLAILLKVFPVLLVAIFLFRKQFRFLIYVAVSGMLLILSTAIFCGFNVWIFYFTDVLSKAFNGGIASAYVPNYQSVFMFLKGLMVFDAVQNPNAFLNLPELFSALLLAFKVGLVGTGFYISRKVSDSLLVLSYWILAMILVSPYGSTYTFILLLFPFLALAKSPVSSLKKAGLLILLLFINNFPLAVFMQNPFPFSYLRLFALASFFILLVALLYRSVNWKMVSLASLAILISVLILKKDEPIHSAYLLPKHSPLLIYDYQIANNRLTCFYWNENGENAKSFPFKIATANPIELKDNQVFYNKKQLTFDTSNKQKPILVDGKTIVYLSDFDRGIGFYTLRKIDLKP